MEGVEDVEEEDVLEDTGDLEDDTDAIGPDIEVASRIPTSWNCCSSIGAVAPRNPHR